MFRIYISKDALENICLDEMCKDSKEQSKWYKIFARQNTIIIDGEEPSADEMDTLWVFSQGEGVSIEKDVEGYIEEITYMHNYETVLNEPCGVFLLNISKEEAINIQKNYGVICQSINDMDDSVFTDEDINYNPNKNEENYTWSKILDDLKDVPSNSIIINDRNIFSNDSLDTKDRWGNPRKGKTTGVDNIFEILNFVLPSEFKTDYHVLVSYEYKDNKPVSKLNIISKRINELRNKLNRPYNIVFEVIYIKFGTPFFEITHNRRIISNYFVLTAEHDIGAFENGKSVSSQNIHGSRLYSCGLYKPSECPFKLYSSMLKDFCRFARAYEKNNPQYGYGYSIDGQEIIVDKFRNRLIS